MNHTVARLCTSLFALGLIITPFAKAANPETGAKVVADLVERIALSSTSKGEIRTTLGDAAHADTLWAAVQTLKSQGGLPKTAAEWVALKQFMKSQDTPVSESVAAIKKAADDKVNLTQENLAKLFGKELTTEESQARTRPVTTTSPLVAFQTAAPQSAETLAFKNELQAKVEKKDADAVARASLIGERIQLANQAYLNCSLAARQECTKLAPEMVLLWAAQGFDLAGKDAVTVLDQALLGFPKDKSGVKGQAEVAIQGMYLSLKLGDKRSESLNHCLKHGGALWN